jgi:N-acetyltransferase 10
MTYQGIPDVIFFLVGGSFRYAIDNSSRDWTMAESQMASSVIHGAGRSTIVSVKSSSEPVSQKRKAEDRDSMGKEKKPTRQGKKQKK